MSKTGQKVARSAKCPFYHKHEKTRIFCDGVYGALSSIQPFENNDVRAAYMTRYCKDREGWQECRLVKGYGEEERDDP